MDVVRRTSRILTLALFMVGGTGMVEAQDKCRDGLVLELFEVDYLPSSFPSLRGCSDLTKVNEVVARALVRSLISEQQENPEKLLHLLGGIQFGYLDGQHRKDFAALVRQVQEALGDSDYRSFINGDEGALARFESFDPLVEEVRSRLREALQDEFAARIPEPANSEENIRPELELDVHKGPSDEGSKKGTNDLGKIPSWVSLAAAGLLALILLVSLVWHFSRRFRRDGRRTRRKGTHPDPPKPSPRVRDDKAQDLGRRIQHLEDDMRQLTSPDPSSPLGELGRKLEVLAQAFERLESRELPIIPDPMTQPLEASMTARDREQLNHLKDKISQLEENLNKLWEQAAERTPEAGEGVIAAQACEVIREHEESLLREAWKRFEKAFPSVVQAAERLDADTAEGELLRNIVTGLQACLEHEPDLCQAVGKESESVREYFRQLHRINYLHKQLTCTDGEAVVEKGMSWYRENAYLLAILQHTNRGEEMARFELKAWIRKSFVVLADQILRAYQQVTLKGRGQDLEEARRLVYTILRQADVEPLEVVLGRTPFDPNVHHGRSQAKEKHLADGTIAAVVRNGFRDLSSGKLFVQPEVVVNRL